MDDLASRGAAPAARPHTRLELFTAFLKMGLLGFGGVMPWARRVLVEERRWLSEREFAELLGMCQILPGPNVVNLSVILGARWQGPLGALVALTGILFVPVIAVLLSTLFEGFAWTGTAVMGVALAATGNFIALKRET